MNINKNKSVSTSVSNVVRKTRFEDPSEESSINVSGGASSSETSTDESSSSSEKPVKKSASDLGKRAITKQRPKPKFGEKINWISCLNQEQRFDMLKMLVTDKADDNKTKVMRLRSYGSVSKKQYEDMVEFLNSPGCETLRSCATQRSFAALAKFSEGEKNRKAQYRQYIVELIRNYHFVFADLSKNWETDFPPGMRVAAVTKLFENPVQDQDQDQDQDQEQKQKKKQKQVEQKQVRLDVSNYRIHIGMHDRKISIKLQDMGKKAAKKAVQDSEAKVLVETLNTEFAKLALNGNDMLVVELLCRDQPFASVVRPLVKNLARYCAQLPQLLALDLSCTSRDELICAGRLGTQESASLFAKFVGDLATIISLSPSLQELKLSMAGIRPEGLSGIANALAKNETIQRLDLSWNALASNPSNKKALRDGIKEFSKMLAANTSMTHLDLSFCEIDDKSADYLFKAISKNETLEFIDLTGNQVMPKHELLKDPRVHYRGKKSPVKSVASSMASGVSSTSDIPKSSRKE